MNYEDRVTKEYVEGLLAGVPKIAAGTYVGNGVSTGHTITLDFPIKAVLVWTTRYYYEDGPTAALCTVGTDYGSGLLTISGNTFTVKSNSSYYPRLNNENGIYFYVAIG